MPFSKVEIARRYRKKHRVRLRLEARHRARRARLKNPTEQNRKLREWRKNNAKRFGATNRAWRRKNIARVRLLGRVQQTVRRALRSGRLIKPKKCQWCGKRRKLQAHHSDYSQPLNVEFICSLCHGHHHKFIETE